MNQALTILVATHYKPLMLLLERAMQGRATVRQVEPLAEHVLALIGINDKPIVVIHAEKEGTEWPNLLKALHRSCPGLKTLAFGDAVDVGPVARGIVYGLSGYVPLNLHPDLREVSKAVRLAATGGPPPADTLFGRVKGMLPISQDGSFTSTSGNSLSREAAIRQCDGLGLTPAETVGFLGVSVDDAKAVAGKASRKVRGGEFAVSGRLKVMGLILIASLALFGLLGRRNEKFFVPVSGTVSLNGQPLPDVIVSFSREGGSHIASGKTDDEGKFRLSTLQQGDGAEAGTHVVWITRRSGVRDYIAMDDPKYTEKMIALREKIRTERESQDKLEETIPMSYFDKTTSSLRAEVEGRKPLNFSFDLKP